ncbi:MAG: FtsQ-type POTRA domain-containing protein [Oscillospiraceae bacterium]
MDKLDEKQQLKRNKMAAVKKPPKRISRKTVRRRRFIKRIITVIISMIILAVCIVMSLKLLFIVRTVEVTGSDIFSQADIVSFCKIQPEENIFKVQTKELEKQIQKEFTYVEAVTVERKLPDKIVIRIVDSVETYYTSTQDAIQIYSQSFRPLRSAKELPDNMMFLDFDIMNTEICDIALQLIDVFKACELEGITSIKIADKNDIRAVYQNRLEIKFGTLLDIEYKVKMCRKLVEEKISPDENAILDATKAGEVVCERR